MQKLSENFLYNSCSNPPPHHQEYRQHSGGRLGIGMRTRINIGTGMGSRLGNTFMVIVYNSGYDPHTGGVG